MRRAARLDTTHRAIVQALRKVGCQVLDLSRLGDGSPDILVRCGRFMNVSGQHSTGTVCVNVWVKAVLMEIKTPTGRLTDLQKDFLQEWPETVIVRSVSEALAAVGVKG